MNRFVDALQFAAIKHRSQKRKDPERTPYINHPIGVAHILSNEANIDDVDVLCAALLHDTIEDTETTFEELEKHFGKRIADLVAELTDDKTLPSKERKSLQIENAHRLSHEAILVRLADKIYNLRDLNRVRPTGWTDERVETYFHWSSRIFRKIRGHNKHLDAILKDLFEQRKISLD